MIKAGREPPLWGKTALTTADAQVLLDFVQGKDSFFFAHHAPNDYVYKTLLEAAGTREMGVPPAPNNGGARVIREGYSCPHHAPPLLGAGGTFFRDNLLCYKTR